MNSADLDSNKVAGAVNEVALVFVLLATHAVVALERTLVDETCVMQLLQKLLNRNLVALFCSANKVLVIDVDGFKKWQPCLVD